MEVTSNAGVCCATSVTEAPAMPTRRTGNQRIRVASLTRPRAASGRPKGRPLPKTGELPRCAGSRGPGLGTEAVLDDLAIERSAADVEQAGRFLLVPITRLEHAKDVIFFVLRQRLQPARFGRRRRCGRERMQEFDVGVADDAAR